MIASAETPLGTKSWTLLGLVAGAVIGSLIGIGKVDLAGLLVGVLLVAAFASRLTLSGWLGFTLLTALFPRMFSTYLGLPAAIDFVHYPIVAIFGLRALRGNSVISTVIARRWLWGLAIVAVASLAANPQNPLRMLVFLVIVGEPLVVIWAISKWAPSPTAIRRVLNIAVIMLLVQLPIGLFQGLTVGWQDPVQGTLIGHGAASHILGGLFALALLAAIAAFRSGRIRIPLMMSAFVLSLGMMGATGSFQVLIASASSLLLMQIAPWVARRRSHRRALFGRTLMLVLTGLFAMATFALTTRIVPGVLERVERMAFLEQPFEVRLIQERMGDPLRLFLGSGPGTTASRAALLLTPAYLKGTSPLRALGLSPTESGLRFSTEVSTSYGGSAESAASSALGIIGDLGVVGFAALGMFFMSAWRVARKSPTWLAYAFQASILMISILMFVDNWLEYPEFTLPLSIVWGCVIAGRGSEDVRIAGHSKADRAFPDVVRA